MSWRQMGLTVPFGQAPELDRGESWDPVEDRVTTAEGGAYTVRRPGYCSLCPNPGLLLRMGCVHEHTWDQILCHAHARRTGLDGDITCLACSGARDGSWHHCDVYVEPGQGYDELSRQQVTA